MIDISQYYAAAAATKARGVYPSGPAKCPILDSDLTRLRRKRSRVHQALDRLEPMVIDYKAKLVELENATQALAPELHLHPRRYKPNPVFAKEELLQLALNSLARGRRADPDAVYCHPCASLQRHSASKPVHHQANPATATADVREMEPARDERETPDGRCSRRGCSGPPG